MKKQIKIGSCIYEIEFSPEVADAVLNKVINWMQDPKHYAAHSGEGIMQSDNTLIDSPELISVIVDDILKPKFLREEDE